MEEQERIKSVNDEWQAPPPPEGLPQPPADETMSLGETLGGIFFNPADTFTALRWKPRFLVAAIIIIVAVMAYQIAFIQKLGYENIIRQQINASPQAEQMSPEQKSRAVALYSNPAMQAFVTASPVIGFIFVFLIGALLYWGAASAFGGTINFPQSLSLFVYSSLPVYVIMMILNLIVLFLKSAEDIDPVASQRGVVQTNLSFLVDPKTQPTLATVLGTFDLFAFYGMFLAALGFQKIARLSASSAWTIVILFWIILFVFRVSMSLTFGVAS